MTTERDVLIKQSTDKHTAHVQLVRDNG